MQIHYKCYMNWTGYSVAAQEYILAMHAVNPSIDVKLDFYNMQTKTGIGPERVKFFHSLKEKPSAQDRIFVHHCIPFRYRRPGGFKRHIAFCIFEAPEIPADWVRKMNEMDMIIAGSQFNASSFKAHGVNVPIKIVQHTFDPQMFHRNIKAPGRYERKTFLSIGTWKQRKNWPMLIRAFYEAFVESDDVCLLVKTDRPRDMKNLVIKIKKEGRFKSKRTAPVYCEDKPCCNFEDIPGIMRKGDFYVTCSLGEGFGYPGLHAMALGIPTILPRFGGIMEYAKEDNTTFIQPTGYKKVPRMDNVPQFNNCTWPILKTNEVAQKMREVFDNPPKEKTERAYEHVHKNFNYQVIGNRFLEALV